MRQDLSGRDRLVTNVFASWAGYLVFFIAGLVLPRLIHEQLGRTALGVWDLAWSLVAYFGLAQLGIGSSVNRYVARYRARGDRRGLARAVNTVWLIQLAAALLALAATLFAAFYLLPVLFAAKLGAFLPEARWLVFWLGSALAVQIAFDTASGIMTGSHRWDWHNALNAGGYAVSVCGMATALWFGGGLAMLAAVYFFTTVATEWLRFRLARRLCPEFARGVAYFSLPHARSMGLFGLKTLSGGLAELFSIQTVQLLVAAALGPAALALFARPYALVRHIKTFVAKFSFVFAPTTSSLQSTGQRAQLAELSVEAMRYGVLIALPPCLGLAWLGDAVLWVWMGPEYAQGALAAVFALGFLFSAAGAPALQVLIGMNAHGRATVALLVASLIAAGLAAAVLELVPGAGLVAVAAAIVLPSMLAYGIFIPGEVCRRLGLPRALYYREVWGRPLRVLVPFAVFLALVRLTWPDRPGWQLTTAIALGIPLIGLSYWRAGFLPQSLRTVLVRARSWPKRLAGALARRTGM
jgi:O-antigen/teichoic acid export membrane protein